MDPASTSTSAPAAPTATTRAPPRPTAGAAPKLTCLCAPTNHPGSFRCSRHRKPSAAQGQGGGEEGHHSHGHGNRGSGRSAARGRSVRALLLQKIATGPSSGRDQRQRGQSRRRGDFQPRPSRLRLMNM